MKFELARFLKRVPQRRAQLGYALDRRDACVAGEWLHTWHMDTEHRERVVRRKLASAAAASAAFRAHVAELERGGYQRHGGNGWTINPRGQRGYFRDGTWSAPKKWSDDVAVEVVTDGKTRTRAVPAAAPPRVVDRRALAHLARAFAPGKRASCAELVAATNAWFAALVAAGLDLEPFASADRDATAIVASGPYSAAQLRAAERALGERLPASYAEMLGAIGDVAVLADFRGRDATYPLATRRGWPLAGTLAGATKVLAYEVDRHREPGSFTAAQLAARRWLRFAANAPGGSDHTFIMDLGRVDRAGEPAIYLVPDSDLPTEIAPRATVFGVRAWLATRVAALHALVRCSL